MNLSSNSCVQIFFIEKETLHAIIESNIFVIVNLCNRIFCFRNQMYICIYKNILSVPILSNIIMACQYFLILSLILLSVTLSHITIFRVEISQSSFSVEKICEFYNNNNDNYGIECKIITAHRQRWQQAKKAQQTLHHYYSQDTEPAHLQFLNNP